MKTSQRNTTPARALPFFVSCAAGPRRPLRYAPRPAGPALRRQKTETSPKRRLNGKLSPCNNQPPLANHCLF